MSRKIIMMVSLLALFSFSGWAFAGEMERFGVISNHDLFSPTTENVYHQMEYHKFENPIKETMRYSTQINHISRPELSDSFSNSHLNNPISKPYMEPISPMTTRWDSGTHDYMQEQFERSFVNSVPDPSNIYVERKLENDLCKTANTMVSVATAPVGGPLAQVGAVANVIHNFGPQAGMAQNLSGNVGDVVSGGSALKTASQAIRGNFSNLGTGVVGVGNTVFGKITDAHKMALTQPVTTSATRHYRFGFNDGFTRTQRVGTITATKTYTPPKTIKTFGPPGIFEGTTTTTLRNHEVMRTNMGNFSPAFKAPKLYTPSFRNPTFNNTTFRTQSFKSPSLRMPTFRPPSFGRIR